MATQPPAYASDRTASKIQRSQTVADMIENLGKRPTSAYSSAFSTNANILSDAILGLAKNKIDKSVERNLGADRRGLADAVLSGFSGPQQEPQAAPVAPPAHKPFEAGGLPQMAPEPAKFDAAPIGAPAPELKAPEPAPGTMPAPVAAPQPAAAAHPVGAMAAPPELALLRSMLGSDNPAMFEQGLALAQAMQERAVKANAPKPLINVADGGSVFDPNTGKTAFENAKADPKKSYSVVKGADGYYGVNTADPADKVDLGITPPKPGNGITMTMDDDGNPVVTIGGVPPAAVKANQAYGSGVGKDSADRRTAVLSGGDAARQQLAKIAELRASLGQVDYTGFGAEQLLGMKKAAKAFGIDVGDDVSAAEAANMVRTGLALEMKKDLPGPMSNGDREFLMAIPPNVSNTREGNTAMMFILNKRAEMARDMDQSLRKANPQTPEEYARWENAYLAERDAKPYFSEAARRDLMRDLGGGQ